MRWFCSITSTVTVLLITQGVRGDLPEVASQPAPPSRWSRSSYPWTPKVVSAWISVRTGCAGRPRDACDARRCGAARPAGVPVLVKGDARFLRTCPGAHGVLKGAGVKGVGLMTVPPRLTILGNTKNSDAMRDNRRRSFRLPVPAVGIHVLAIGLLIVSLEFTPPPAGQPQGTEVVQAVTVDEQKSQGRGRAAGAGRTAQAR